MPDPGKPLVDYQISDSAAGPFSDAKTKPKAQSNPKSKSQGPLPPWREGAIAAWSAQIYRLIGSAWSTFDPVCGGMVLQIADPVGQTWEKMAKQNQWLRRMFGYLMTTSIATELLMAHIPLFVAILTHHGPFQQSMTNMSQKFEAEFADVLKKNKEEAKAA